MAKNIVVFSDGTGQDGGSRPEQRVSNIYKMYRVCRNGPDSDIHPDDQIAASAPTSAQPHCRPWASSARSSWRR